jgi:hypothetical protein
VPSSQFVQPFQDDEEEEPWADVQDPQDLYWWLMTKGERSVDWKPVDLFCICSVCTNLVEPVSRSRWHRFWCVSVSLSISSVRQTRWHRVATGFGCCMQQAHVIKSL